MTLQIKKEMTVRLLNPEGDFQLALYRDSRDDQEHLALFHGDLSGEENVLVRVHSECFTNDELNSHRCDCSAQLHTSMEKITENGAGIVIYLWQGGRGIDLLNKVKTYNLQVAGYDTIDTNMQTDREADERSCEVAAEILKDLGVQSIRLLTNNPANIEGLQSAGIDVTERVPLETPPPAENRKHLREKQQRLAQLLDLDTDNFSPGTSSETELVLKEIEAMMAVHLDGRVSRQPQITLSFAQSLDGSIAFTPGKQLTISGRQSMALTHGLRAIHDAILIGIGTVLSDDPQLTVRLNDGQDPQPVIVDSHLKIPPECQLLSNDVHPVIATTKQAPSQTMALLESTGAEVVVLPATENGQVDLTALMSHLKSKGIQSVMVEGGAGIITSFLNEKLVDIIVLTIAPQFLGGLRGVGNLNVNDPTTPPGLRDLHHRQIGTDLIVWGKAYWSNQ